MRWLIDEMLPPATAAELNTLGHEAISAREAGLGSSDDADLYAAAVSQRRVIVTENFADFAALSGRQLAAGQPSAPVVFVRKRDHPGGSTLAAALARHLHRWAADNPEPYPGIHWP